MCEEQNEKDMIDFDALWAGLGESVEKVVELIKHLAEQITATIQPVLNMFLPIVELIKTKYRRVYHLAVHGRTKRIRKKNQRRLFEIVFGKKGVCHGERLDGQSTQHL